VEQRKDKPKDTS